MKQPTPAEIEVYRGADDVRQLAAGYQSVQLDGNAVVAKAQVSGAGRAAFAVEDRWTIAGPALLLSRKVSVTSAEENAGYYSGVRLATVPAVKWEDASFLVPGLLYGDSAHAGRGGPASAASHSSKRFAIREDYLSAPLFAMSLPDGNWAAVLDCAPRGDTTQAEVSASAATPIVDERIQFGAVGGRELAAGGVEMGFWLPGTTTEIGGGRGRGRGPAAGGATPTVRRRYHPVAAGFAHNYEVGFRFDRSASFREMQRDAWRWAWQSLAPKAVPVDVELVRRSLIDHLSDRVLTVDDRAGVPFELDSVTARPSRYADKIIMGFCGSRGCRSSTA
jgi:hypothetical protein